MSWQIWMALVLNVVGGILAAWVFSIWAAGRKLLWQSKFKQVFGQKASQEGITLVYEELALKSGTETHPYRKPNSQISSDFSISRPIPIASVRAVNYLASTIGNFTGKTPFVLSDFDVRDKMDFDFVCFGGPFSNVMTQSCQDNAGNRLAYFNQQQNQFVLKPDGKSVAQLTPGPDYGLILKVHPTQFPQRVWISCAGINERGTSGAAWFLANKWNVLYKHARGNPFAAVIRVEADVLNGRDQSAELLKLLVLDGTRVHTIDFET